MPFIAALLWYQWRITGDPFRPSYYVGGREVDHLYFHRYEIRQGIWLSVQRLTDLGVWTSPALVIVWLRSLAVKAKRRALTCEDAVFPLGVLVFTCYPFPAGNKFGPRYYYDFFPMLVYTVGSVGPFLTTHTRRVFGQIMMMTLALELTLWPHLAVAYHRIATERSDLYDQVRSRRLKDAVVCVARGAGETLTLAYHDLVRNDINAAGPVLYADCVKTTPEDLRREFPTRSIWLYQGGSPLHGSLTRVH